MPPYPAGYIPGGCKTCNAAANSHKLAAQRQHFIIEFFKDTVQTFYFICEPTLRKTYIRRNYHTQHNPYILFHLHFFFNFKISLIKPPLGGWGLSNTM